MRGNKRGHIIATITTLRIINIFHMASQNTKFDFKALKTKVGVTDVARALGYIIDRKAGVGRYVEMVKIVDGKKTDTLVIRNPQDKANQLYFRRDGRKGDAISLIRENLGMFNVPSGANEWKRIGNVLSRLANEPLPMTEDDRTISEARVAKEFDKDRYKIEEFKPSMGVPGIVAARGINEGTFRTFLPFITKLYDMENQGYKGYNVGFPYTEPGDGRIQGYEIRGNGGYKSKAAGTNSSSAAWIADFSGGMPGTVRHIFFFESAFDAMGFYQLNSTKLELSRSVFVSVGGQMSDSQIKNIMRHYPNAKAIDCYDNDLSGKIYGLRTACLAAGLHASVMKAPGGISVQSGEVSIVLPEKDACIKSLGKHLPLEDKAGEWKADASFKDWNDVVMGKRSEVVINMNKFQRDDALAERRRGLKI